MFAVEKRKEKHCCSEKRNRLSGDRGDTKDFGQRGVVVESEEFLSDREKSL